MCWYLHDTCWRMGTLTVYTLSSVPMKIQVDSLVKLELSNWFLLLCKKRTSWSVKWWLWLSRERRVNIISRAKIIYEGAIAMTERLCEVLRCGTFTNYDWCESGSRMWITNGKKRNFFLFITFGKWYRYAMCWEEQFSWLLGLNLTAVANKWTCSFICLSEYLTLKCKAKEVPN